MQRHAKPRKVELPYTWIHKNDCAVYSEGAHACLKMEIRLAYLCIVQHYKHRFTHTLRTVWVNWHCESKSIKNEMKSLSLTWSIEMGGQKWNGYQCLQMMTRTSKFWSPECCSHHTRVRNANSRYIPSSGKKVKLHLSKIIINPQQLRVELHISCAIDFLYYTNAIHRIGV